MSTISDAGALRRRAERLVGVNTENPPGREREAGTLLGMFVAAEEAASLGLRGTSAPPQQRDYTIV